MKTKIHHNISTLPESYSGIFAVAAKQSIFFSRPWFDNFIETVVKKDMQPYTITAIEDGERDEPRALFLTQLSIEKKGPFTRNKLCSLSNYYTSLFGPILDYQETNIGELCEKLIEGLLQQNPKLDIIDLNPLEVDAPVHKALKTAFKKKGWITQEYFCFGNWFLPSEGLNIDDYIASRPSKLRNTLKRKKKKFDKEPGSRIEIITNINNMQEALEAFQSVYEKSWKEPEPYTEFLPGLVETLAKNGLLRLGVAWINDKPAAAQLWIVNDCTASIFKLAYDPEFNKLSVGSLLTLTLMEHVLEKDKVKEVDYLTGDDKYKQDWMSHRRERFGLIAFNPHSAAGLLTAAKNIIGHTIKSFYKKITGSK